MIPNPEVEIERDRDTLERFEASIIEIVAARKAITEKFRALVTRLKELEEERDIVEASIQMLLRNGMARDADMIQKALDDFLFTPPPQEEKQ